jgi:hypothetical protein
MCNKECAAHSGRARPSECRKCRRQVRHATVTRAAAAHALFLIQCECGCQARTAVDASAARHATVASTAATLATSPSRGLQAQVTCASQLVPKSSEDSVPCRAYGNSVAAALVGL